jgi:hypothetical protein
MEIHMARRDTAMKRYWRVRPALRLGAAIAEASKKLTGLSPSEFETIIRSPKAVLLNGVDWESVYLMFYSVPRGRIYIAVASAAEEAHQDGQPVVADILTVEDYELQGGVVDMNNLRRAAAAALNPVEFRAWEARTFGDDYERPRPRVFIHYTKPDGQVSTRYLKRPPVCQAYIDEFGMENSLGHPGFKEWMKAALERAQINIEKQVVCMEIVDAVKMTLRVDAPDRSCPHCAPVASSQTKAPREPVPDTAPAPRTPGWLRRLIGRFAKA